MEMIALFKDAHTNATAIMIAIRINIARTSSATMHAINAARERFVMAFQIIVHCANVQKHISDRHTQNADQNATETSIVHLANPLAFMESAKTLAKVISNDFQFNL
jgi:hypothetical protein